MWDSRNTVKKKLQILGSAGKESACSAGDLGSVPGLGRPPEEGNGNPLQYSGLENFGLGCKESDRTEWLSLLGAFLIAQLVKNLPAMQETWVRSLGWKDPLGRKRLPTPVFWAGEFHALYSPWGYKESKMTEGWKGKKYQNIPWKTERISDVHFFLRMDGSLLKWTRTKTLNKGE